MSAIPGYNGLLRKETAALPVAAPDWDHMLNAVKLRLNLTVGELSAQGHGQTDNHVLSRFCISVLECVESLDALQTRLDCELDRNALLKLEMLETQSALLQARKELLGTRAGERRARHSAEHDSLTQLPNRSYFENQLQHAMGEPHASELGLAILFLDLDEFKAVNDTQGHGAGDELLRVVAARLNQAVRMEDVVCRLGGDEFACLLRGLGNRKQLTQLAAKLFDSVKAPCKIGTHDLTVRPSIGIAICPSDGLTPESLLRNADAAMYHAKRQRTGYAFYDECTQGA
ncbi:hypothetical protein CHU94_05510 [Rhodoferax sp. TH121]|uniref:GGDEF domain-containing protein n=1 Tax=Rhodoferax sp. TH121 TaxID=2022803 RepID=UPI000B95DBEE|nr:GGDEF domain-containing protein [Rhodoferax sp. TH121]OYQ41826.1 hypothetical protein CHU94_05510 [Rhodoferax sp. TH121]